MSFIEDGRSVTGFSPATFEGIVEHEAESQFDESFANHWGASLDKVLSEAAVIFLTHHNIRKLEMSSVLDAVFDQLAPFTSLETQTLRLVVV